MLFVGVPSMVSESKYARARVADRDLIVLKVMEIRGGRWSQSPNRILNIQASNHDPMTDGKLGGIGRRLACDLIKILGLIVYQSETID